jgi:hypothetical protein
MSYRYMIRNIISAKTRCKRQAPRTVHSVVYLDHSFELFACKAAVAVEAFALAITVVKTTVGTFGELGKVAKVLVVVDLGYRDDRTSGGHASGDGERTSRTYCCVDFEEVLNTSLAGLVSELDLEIHLENFPAEAILTGGCAN